MLIVTEFLWIVLNYQDRKRIKRERRKKNATMKTVKKSQKFFHYCVKKDPPDIIQQKLSDFVHLLITTVKQTKSHHLSLLKNG